MKSNLVTDDNKNCSKRTVLFDNRISEEWLTTKQAAEYLQLSVSEIHNLCSAGKIVYYKLADGKRSRYLRRDLDELLLQNRRGGHSGKS
jgi:excisionase family DNA binding protein